MVAHITGRSIAQESRAATCTLDLVKKIRQRHLRWLGHLLRTGEHRLTYHALQVQLLMQRRAGNLFMDAPPFDNLKELSDLAQDRCKWGIGGARLTWHCGVNYGLLYLSEKKRKYLFVKFFVTIRIVLEFI